MTLQIKSTKICTQRDVLKIERALGRERERERASGSSWLKVYESKAERGMKTTRRPGLCMRQQKLEKQQQKRTTTTPQRALKEEMKKIAKIALPQR